MRHARPARPMIALLVLAAGCAAWRPETPSTLAEARQLFDGKRYAEAATRLGDTQLRKLRSREVPRGYELRGQCLERLGRSDDALRTYQVGVAQYPKDINLLTYLGNLLHHNDLDAQARPYYERILKLSPDNAAAHLGLAETERGLGFLDRAAAHYEATLKTWSDQPGIWLDYAEALSGARRDGQALDAAQQALMLAETAGARSAQARYLWRLNRRDEAFNSLAQAEYLEPGRIEFIQQRGLWSLEAGDLDKAESAATMALTLTPDDPLGLWLRGSVRLRRGKTEEARRDLERAAAQRGSPFVAAAAEGILKQLR